MCTHAFAHACKVLRGPLKSLHFVNMVRNSFKVTNQSVNPGPRWQWQISDYQTMRQLPKGREVLVWTSPSRAYKLSKLKKKLIKNNIYNKMKRKIKQIKKNKCNLKKLNAWMKIFYELKIKTPKESGLPKRFSCPVGSTGIPFYNTVFCESLLQRLQHL